MMEAQAFLQIFCWQGSIDLQYESRKRGIALQCQVPVEKKSFIVQNAKVG